MISYRDLARLQTTPHIYHQRLKLMTIYKVKSKILARLRFSTGTANLEYSHTRVRTIHTATSFNQRNIIRTVTIKDLSKEVQVTVLANAFNQAFLSIRIQVTWAVCSEDRTRDNNFKLLLSINSNVLSWDSLEDNYKFKGRLKCHCRYSNYTPHLTPKHNPLTIIVRE